MEMWLKILLGFVIVSLIGVSIAACVLAVENKDARENGTQDLEVASLKVGPLTYTDTAPGVEGLVLTSDGKGSMQFLAPAVSVDAASTPQPFAIPTFSQPGSGKLRTSGALVDEAGNISAGTYNGYVPVQSTASAGAAGSVPMLDATGHVLEASPLSVSGGNLTGVTQINGRGVVNYGRSPTLYVNSATGSNSNSGLAPSVALADVFGAVNLLNSNQWSADAVIECAQGQVANVGAGGDLVIFGKSGARSATITAPIAATAVTYDVGSVSVDQYYSVTYTITSASPPVAGALVGHMLSTVVNGTALTSIVTANTATTVTTQDNYAQSVAGATAITVFRPDATLSGLTKLESVDCDAVVSNMLITAPTIGTQHFISTKNDSCILRGCELQISQVNFSFACNLDTCAVDLGSGGLDLRALSSTSVTNCFFVGDDQLTLGGAVSIYGSSLGSTLRVVEASSASVSRVRFTQLGAAQNTLVAVEESFLVANHVDASVVEASVTDALMAVRAGSAVTLDSMRMSKAVSKPVFLVDSLSTLRARNVTNTNGDSSAYPLVDASNAGAAFLSGVLLDDAATYILGASTGAVRPTPATANVVLASMATLGASLTVSAN